MSLPFQSEDEVIEAANGEYGDVRQREAEQLIAQFQAEQAQTEHRDTFVREIERLQEHTGRNLTSKEIQDYWQRIPDGEVPDLIETFGDEAGSRTSDEREREALTAEHVEDAWNPPVDAEESVL